MFRKLLPQLILAFIFLILTVSQQYLFYGIKGLPIIPLSPAKYLGITFVFFLLTFTKNHKVRFLFLSFILILNYFQMAHLSYYGTQILPAEIYLLFSEMREVGGTLGAELQHIFIPLTYTIIPLGLGWWANKKLEPKVQFKFIPLLFCLYFAYKPSRTYVTGNTWGRQPSTRELSGLNVYLSLSYFLGKILPHKISGHEFKGTNSSLDLVLEPKKKSDWDNVIVVLGESLTPNHMQLFGYARATTPTLQALKDHPQFKFVKSLSSGVSTDISVAFFLNLGFGSAGVKKAAQGQNCLFKLAKNNGFVTSFYSMQSEHQLRYIAPYLCSAYLDDYKSMEDIAPHTIDHNAAIDREMLPSLENLLIKKQKNFVILHQRGSHAPWSARYTKESNIFKNDGKETRLDDYDNSVVEFDHFWDELTTLLLKVPGKNLVIYLSDHGEGLGENGLWGHGTLTPISFEVPLLIQSFNADLPRGTQDLPEFIPQYHVSLLIAESLGFKANQDYRKMPKDYVIYGNDIDGFAGKALIHFASGGYTFKVIP